MRTLRLGIVVALIALSSGAPAVSEGASIAVGGTVQVTNTRGIGLQLRESPSRNARVLTNVPDGTRLSVKSGPVQRDGHVWWQISSPQGSGWAAGDWLVAVEPTPPRPTSPVQPQQTARLHPPKPTPPPVARIDVIAEGQRVHEGQEAKVVVPRGGQATVTANGARSSAGQGGQLVLHQWYINGQPAGAQPEISRRLSPGSYEFRVLVRDNSQQEAQASVRVVVAETPLSARIIGVEPRADANAIALGVHLHHTGPIYISCEFRAGRQVVSRAPQRIDGSGEKRLSACAVAYQELEAQRPAPGQPPLPISANFVLLQGQKVYAGELHRWQGQVGQLIAKTEPPSPPAAGRILNVEVRPGPQGVALVARVQHSGPLYLGCTYRVAGREIHRPAVPLSGSGEKTLEPCALRYEDAGLKPPAIGQPPLVVEATLALKETGGQMREVHRWGWQPVARLDPTHVTASARVLSVESRPDANAIGLVVHLQHGAPVYVACEFRAGRQSVTRPPQRIEGAGEKRLSACAVAYQELEAQRPAPGQPALPISANIVLLQGPQGGELHRWQGQVGQLIAKTEPPSHPAAGRILNVEVRAGAQGVALVARVQHSGPLYLGCSYRVAGRVIDPPAVRLEGSGEKTVPACALQYEAAGLKPPAVGQPPLVVAATLALYREQSSGLMHGEVHRWGLQEVARIDPAPATTSARVLGVEPRADANAIELVVHVQHGAPVYVACEFRAGIQTVPRASRQRIEGAGEKRLSACAVAYQEFDAQRPVPGQPPLPISATVVLLQGPRGGELHRWQGQVGQLVAKTEPPAPPAAGRIVNVEVRPGAQGVALVARVQHSGPLYLGCSYRVAGRVIDRPAVRLEGSGEKTGQTCTLQYGETGLKPPAIGQPPLVVEATLALWRGQTGGQMQGEVHRWGWQEVARIDPRSGHPQVAVTPSSVASGGAVQETGTGFTPNATVTLHVRRPDGGELQPRKESTKPDGSFGVSVPIAPGSSPGAYTSYAVDDRTGRRSNEARFEVTGGVLLSVSKVGTGSGTVTSRPSGISCAGGERDTCSSGFPLGSTLVLTAAPAPGGNDAFAGWGGDCAGLGANANCAVTMNWARSVTATFNVASVNQPPVARIDATSGGQSAQENGELRVVVPPGAREATVTLSARRSQPAGVGVLWQVPGKQLGREPEIRHAFPVGTHLVILLVWPTPRHEGPNPPLPPIIHRVKDGQTTAALRAGVGSEAQVRITVVADATSAPVARIDATAQGQTARENGDLRLTLPIAPPDAAVKQASVTLSAARSEAAGSAKYTWHLGQKPLAQGRDVTVPIPQGDHLVRLVVEDGRARIAQAQLRVSISIAGKSNLAPIARLDLEAGGQRAQENQALDVAVPKGSQVAVRLSGARSSDQDGKIVRYRWDLNGSLVGEQPELSRSLSPGSYTVRLTVSDDRGATAAAEARVIVREGPPTQDPPPSQTALKLVVQPDKVSAGSAVQILGTGFTPAGVVTVHVRRPTGTVLESANPKPGSDGAFAVPFVVPTGQPTGTYTVWAVDERTGRKSNEATFTWGVAPAVVAPTVVARIDATAQGQTAREGGELRIVAPASSPLGATVTLSAIRSEPAAAIQNYSWQGWFLSGGSVRGLSVSQSLRAGSYIVTLTVSTADGASAQAQIRIVVLGTATAPVARIDASAQGQRAQEGQELRLSVPRSSPQATVILSAARSERARDDASYSWHSQWYEEPRADRNLGTERDVRSSFSLGTHLVTLGVGGGTGADVAAGRVGAGTSMAQVRIVVQAQPDQPPVVARIDATASGQSAQENGELRVVVPPGAREATVALSARRSQPLGAEFLWSTSTGLEFSRAFPRRPGAPLAPVVLLGTGLEISGAFPVGTQVVTLTVRPPKGTETHAQVRITVGADAAPVARIDATALGQNARENEHLRLSYGSSTLPVGPDEPVRQVSVTLSAARSEAAGSAKYMWYLGQNPLAQGRDVTVLMKDGDHLVRLVVEDGRARTAQAQVRVSSSFARGPALLARIDARSQSQIARENSELRVTIPAGARDVPVSFSGARSEPAGAIAQYVWQTTSGPLGTGRDLERPFAPGTYDVTLRVSNARGDTAQAPVRVTVVVGAREVAPIAHIDATAQGSRAQENGELRLTVPAGAQDVAVSLSAARSEAGAGGQYLWEAQSGVLGNERDITRPLPSGSHVVTLTVRNAQGATAQARVSIMIDPQQASPPAVADTPPAVTAAPQIVPPPSRPPLQPIQPPTITFEFPPPAPAPAPVMGLARPSIPVPGESVPFGSSPPASIPPTPPAPPESLALVARIDARAGEQQAQEGQELRVSTSPGTEAQVVLSGSRSEGRPGGITQYIWEIGARILGTGAELKRPFRPGTHTVTLTVLDAQGARVQAQVRVVVGEEGAGEGQPERETR